MNLNKEISKISEYFAPRIIGEVNDVYIKLAKVKGDEIPWHSHKNEDEMFQVLRGSMLMEIENKEPFTMNAGDVYIVKKGISHRISSVEECHILLVENKTTQHTGDVVTKVTKSIDSQRY